MSYQMKEPRPVRRGKLISPALIEDVKLVASEICAINSIYEDDGTPVLADEKRWKKVHAAALRLRARMVKR